MDALIRTLAGDYRWVIDVIAYTVLIASLIIKATPTLKDDNFFLPVVKFVGRFIALNKYGPDAR